MKLFTLLFIFLLVSNVHAQDRWELAASTKNCKIYIDKRTIEKEGYIVSVWQKEKFNDREEYFNAEGTNFYYDERRANVLYDCENKQLKYQNLIFYLNGTVVNDVDLIQNKKWSKIVPETLGENLLDFISNLIYPVLNEKSLIIKQFPENGLPEHPIISERIYGNANVSDRINGNIIFKLVDKTAVTCSEQEKDWYEIGIRMEITYSEKNTKIIRKGRKIVVDGYIVGELTKDVELNDTNISGNMVQLIGFTPKENIYTNTIIENSLAEYVNGKNERSFDGLKPFISDFDLLNIENFYHPFNTFYYSETGYDDADPFFRIQLIFESNRLIGIFHTRPIPIPNMTDFKLEQGWTVAFFNDVNQLTRDKYIKQFNLFINSVN